MTELVAKYLDNDLVRVVNGAVPETTKVRADPGAGGLDLTHLRGM